MSCSFSRRATRSSSALSFSACVEESQQRAGRERERGGRTVEDVGALVDEGEGVLEVEVEEEVVEASGDDDLARVGAAGTCTG